MNLEKKENVKINVRYREIDNRYWCYMCWLGSLWTIREIYRLQNQPATAERERERMCVNRLIAFAFL